MPQVRVSQKTKDRLDKKKKHSRETYGDVIDRLLEADK